MFTVVKTSLPSYLIIMYNFRKEYLLNCQIVTFTKKSTAPLINHNLQMKSSLNLSRCAVQDAPGVA
jgi:hypothetical protein